MPETGKVTLDTIETTTAALSIERATMAILPWLIPLLASLISITLFPELTLWLPRVVGMIK